jgi:hypothetical protein
LAGFVTAFPIDVSRSDVVVTAVKPADHKPHRWLGANDARLSYFVWYTIPMAPTTDMATVTH